MRYRNCLLNCYRITLTYFIGHPRNNHDFLSHGVHVVDIELGNSGVQWSAEQVHEVNQFIGSAMGSQISKSNNITKEDSHIIKFLCQNLDNRSLLGKILTALSMDDFSMKIYPFPLQIPDYCLWKKVMECLFCLHLFCVKESNLFHYFFGKNLFKRIIKAVLGRVGTFTSIYRTFFTYPNDW